MFSDRIRVRQRVGAGVGVPGEAAAARARLLARQLGGPLAVLEPRAVRVAGAVVCSTGLAQPLAGLARVSTGDAATDSRAPATYPPLR